VLGKDGEMNNRTVLVRFLVFGTVLPGRIRSSSESGGPLSGWNRRSAASRRAKQDAQRRCRHYRINDRRQAKRKTVSDRGRFARSAWGVW
jgi:hypothetical protein